LFIQAKEQWQTLITSVRTQGQLHLPFTEDRIFGLSVYAVGRNQIKPTTKVMILQMEVKS
jgi:hypothetical protein